MKNTHAEIAIAWEKEKGRLRDILSPKEFKRMVDCHVHRETLRIAIPIWDELTGRTFAPRNDDRALTGRGGRGW